jgi:hypothetical protein
MKKRSKTRSRIKATSSSSVAHGWIILLLVILVGLTGIDLYLDHFKGNRQKATEPFSEVSTESVDNGQASEPVQQQTAPEPAIAEKETVPEETKPLSRKPGPEDIKVEVLNGCGVRGIAARVRGILRDRGFDVMSYGNAARQDYGKTLIIVRSEGDFGVRAAEVLARSLRVDEDQIRVERDPSLVDIDLTVILGLDHRTLDL